jgi:hypothetical protein
LAVDAEGVMLGPDCVLVQRRPDGGYRCADANAVALLARIVFDDDARLRRLPLVLSKIVVALDRRDLVKAQLLGLEIPIERLDEPRLERLGRVTDLLKDGFDPNQLRDEYGRWAREGGQAVRALARRSLLGRLAPAALRALATLGAAATAGTLEATAFLGIIFIPTNRSLISQGPVAGQPDLSYEYDQGAGTLRLYQQDGERRSIVFQGRPDIDGIIRDDDGQAVGRKLGDSVVMLDSDALPDSKSQDGEPKLCPDPEDDRPGDKKTKDIAYQKQITGLGAGLAVRLPSRSDDPARDPYVYFDGCRENDGTMLEAKGTGYLEMLERDSDYPWDGVEAKMLDQAKRQLDQQTPNYGNPYASRTVTEMGSRYSIVAYWGPRAQSPETCVTPFLSMLDGLSAIDPVFGKWTFLGPSKGTPLAPLGRDALIELIADGISREDDGTPYLEGGYMFGASNGLKRTGRGIKVRVNAGSTLSANYLINSAHLMTEPLDDRNASFINANVFKAALLTLASAWNATWCGASPSGISAFEAQPLPPRPRFGLEWMTYISPRFAPMVTPPHSAVVEKVPGGGLLMMATEERFEATNPAHLAIARDIEAALAPINALPWPPDAAPDSCHALQRS